MTSGTDYKTTATFTGKGTGAGNQTFTASVAADENGNWDAVSKDFKVYTVISKFTYSYEGHTQQFECKATGEYLEVPT